MGCEAACRCDGNDSFGCVSMCPPVGKYRYPEDNMTAYIIHHGFLGQSTDYM